MKLTVSLTRTLTILCDKHKIVYIPLFKNGEHFIFNFKRKEVFLCEAI